LLKSWLAILQTSSCRVLARLKSPQATNCRQWFLVVVWLVISGTRMFINKYRAAAVWRDEEGKPSQQLMVGEH